MQPVMRKHRWRVPLVTEFFPNNAALLVRPHGPSWQRGSFARVASCVGSAARTKYPGAGAWLAYAQTVRSVPDRANPDMRAYCVRRA